MVKSSVVVILRLGRAALTAVSAAVVMLAQLNLPSTQFWQDWILAQWVSVALITVFAFAEAIRQFSYAVLATRVREYENDLQAAMSAAVALIEDKFGAPWDEIAVSFYRLGFSAVGRKLFRIGGVRAGAVLRDVETHYRPRVGPVGIAFDDKTNHVVEWKDFARTATNEGPDRWNNRTPRERYGLTWGQLQRSLRPSGIVASPTFNRKGKPNGCLLISGPLKKTDLKSDNMRSILNDLATVVDRLGPLPKGWWSAHER